MNEPIPNGLEELLPLKLRELDYNQSTIPALAKSPASVQEIRQVLQHLPTSHHLHLGDARSMDFLKEASVHLIVTSPPYWTLKRYRDGEGQMGHVEDYDEFLASLDEVWRQCYHALVPGGRVICVVGDVCLSRRKNNGRHTVVPLHASIQERCRLIGYDNLAPIIWHKIANVAYEAGGGGFLGKPYEPNGVLKNDIEFILLQRKPGGYRKPALPTRLMSVIGEDEHRQWFQQIWSNLTGASTRDHPAPYPVALAERLIRMFSFVGDVVLDPFMGTGTTTIAASRAGRNSIGVEVDPAYFSYAESRICTETSSLFSELNIQTFNGQVKV